jgi:hypothetical protein
MLEQFVKLTNLIVNLHKTGYYCSDVDIVEDGKQYDKQQALLKLREYGLGVFKINNGLWDICWSDNAINRLNKV